jgi:two-component system NtrC family sensor kinase
MSGETVLIIDDSTELRTTLEAVLLFGGYKSRSVATGQEGIEAVAQKQPDLILIDLELPDTTGLKVLEEFNQQGLSIPTIMMTGYGSEGTAARALRMGVRDYLVKPFTTDEVLSSIDRALEESRLRADNQVWAARWASLGHGLELLAEIGEELFSDQLEAGLLQRIIEIGHALVSAEGTFLLLLAPDGQQLQVAVAQGQLETLSGRWPAQGGDPRLKPVLLESETTRLQSGKGREIALQTGSLVRAVLQVPVFRNGAVQGLVSADRRIDPEPFDSYDEQLLRILASHVSLALEKLGSDVTL